MNLLYKVLKSKSLFLLFISFLLSNCIDPIEPEFEYKEGQIYVEAFLTTTTGSSFVSVYESIVEYGVYKNIFIEGATVYFKNVETGDQVNLVEEEDTYTPPTGFKATVGESWELYITLEDGTQFQSLSEQIKAPVTINAIEATYKTDLVYNESLGDYIPGHSISVDFEDPSNETNYYYWRFRSFETLINCGTCYKGLFRDGECVAYEGDPFYTYGCETKCYRIRHSENIQILADEFVNGLAVNSLAVGNVPLYTKRNILVELQQLSLTPAAHKYYKTLKDILDNNGGFNAPPPAALIGNMFNPNDSEAYILGRFTAAASSTASIYIDRKEITEAQLDDSESGNYEQYGVVPDPQTVSIPCEETRYRTGVTPQGWIN